jgi:hypothetical protein
LVNVAGGTVQGTQVGLVNVAGHQRGWALGLVNIAPEIEAHAQLWADELLLGNAAFYMGTEHWHSFIGAGVTAPVGRTGQLSGLPTRWGIRSGLGVGTSLGQAFGELDATYTSISNTSHWDFEGAGIPGLRLTVGYHLAPRITVVGGLTQNLFITSSATPTPPVLALPIAPIPIGRGAVSTWTGGFVGLRI